MTRKEIRQIIGKLRDSSAGDDIIKASIIKFLADKIAIPLQDLIILSLHQGALPQTVKSALVSPIPKVKEISNISNYQPVLVLEAISKIYWISFLFDDILIFNTT